MAKDTPKPDADERPSRAFLKRLYANIKEMSGGDALSLDAWTTAIRNARSHAGGKAKAANRKKEKEMSSATAEQVTFERRFLAAEDDVYQQTGLMIAFYPSTDAAAKLAIPDGEAPEDLHLTLAFLGDYRKYGELARAHILNVVENMAGWCAPLDAEVSGTGRFVSSGEDIDVFYASIDSPGLNEFRADLVRRLTHAGVPPSGEHGFDPHITLAYISSDAQTPNFDNLAGQALRFETVCVVFGDDEVEFRLSGMTSAAVSASIYHEVADLCASGSPIRLFNEMPAIFAEPPEWINYLPKPGEYTHPEYGKMSFTLERNQRFVDNFDRKVYQEKLPIDTEHDLQSSGAVGWITLMRLNDDGSVDARSEWNERGQKLIEEDRFKYFSPAWFNTWTDPVSTTKVKDVAIGGALCTRPFFKEKSLRPLVSSERGLELADKTVIENRDGNTEIFFTTLTPVKASAIPTADEDTTMTFKRFDPTKPPTTLAEAIEMLTGHQTELTARESDISSALTQALEFCDKAKPPTTLAEAVTAIGEKAKAGVQTASEKGQEAQQAAEQVTKLTEQVTKLTEQMTAMQATERTKRFELLAKEFVGDRAGHVQTLEVLAASEKGEESPAFTAYVTNQKAHAAQVRASGVFSEVGATGGAAGSESAEAKIDTEAKALKTASEGKLTYEMAYAQVIKDKPELYKEYLAQARGEQPVAAAAQ